MQKYQKEFMIFADFELLTAETMTKSTCKLTSKRQQITTAKEARKGLIRAILDFARNIHA